MFHAPLGSARLRPPVYAVQFSEDFFEEIGMTQEDFQQQYVVLDHW